jgi:DNA-binding CsgD family transcriptional regulator
MAHDSETTGKKLPADISWKEMKKINAALDLSLLFEDDSPVIGLTIRLDDEQVAAFLKKIIEKPGNGFLINRENAVPELSIVNKTALTNRETDIMNKLSVGLLYKEIAKDLGISINTVKNHLKHIYSKLSVANRSEAIVKYLRMPGNSYKIR